MSPTSYGLSRIRGDETFHRNRFSLGLSPTDWAELEAMKLDDGEHTAITAGPTDWAELEAMKRRKVSNYIPSFMSYGLSRIRGDETFDKSPSEGGLLSYGLSRIRGDETLVCSKPFNFAESYGLSRIRGDETW